MIEVIKAGLYSSIHDLGRSGYRNIGVPASGAMDKQSAAFANLLLNNPPDAAVLETTFTGPELKFNKETSIVITGAESRIHINNKPVAMQRMYNIKKGDIVSIGRSDVGVRAYLAIKGGFKTEKVMGSRSFFKGVTASFRLKKGDKLAMKAYAAKKQDLSARIQINTDLFNCTALEVTKGPEWELFEEKKLLELIKSKITISPVNDRMGYRMKEALLPHTHSLITGPVLPGTVQVLPSGNLVVLMRDAQTTGGYPRLLQLSDFAISVLAQKKSGDTIRFKCV